MSVGDAVGDRFEGIEELFDADGEWVVPVVPLLTDDGSAFPAPDWIFPTTLIDKPTVSTSVKSA